MTEKECREVVERVAGPLADAMGISHWNIVITYAYHAEDAAACCEPNPKYQHAHVRFNCENVGDAGEVLRALYHEYCHVLVSPFRTILDAYTPQIKDRSDDASTYNKLFDYFDEQLVINAERMFRGLGGVEKFLPLAEGKVVAVKTKPPKPAPRPKRKSAGK